MTDTLSIHIPYPLLIRTVPNSEVREAYPSGVLPFIILLGVLIINSVAMIL